MQCLAGMEGFEPPDAGTRNQCLTTWRHPITIIIIIYKMDLFYVSVSLVPKTQVTFRDPASQSNKLVYL